MSSFGAKRKARKITVQDDNDDDGPPTASLNPPPEPQEPALQATFKTSRNKPFKHSSLRKSINVHEEPPTDSHKSSTTHTNDDAAEDDEDGGAPLRVRPSTAKPMSNKSKKRQSTVSRLSFGPSEMGTDDEDSMVLGGEEIFTPMKKSSLASTAVENNAYKKGISKNLPPNRLPMRSLDNDDDRPRYSKEYLSELQSSTPNTPQNLSKLHPANSEDEEMSLDPSELDGAMIVDTEEPRSLTTAEAPTSVLTEAEIQEKKARRARLAKQQGSGKDTEDFISLSDDGRENGDSYLTVLSRKSGGSKSKSDTRLVAEDEDLGEGYDDFVEDGGLSLGRKAEREARRRQRAEMASLITAAEGGGSDGEQDSDDSEAERRAAYEAAQTRAGMDGLAEEREQQRRRLGAGNGVVPVPAKMTPLPDLSVVVAEFKAQVRRKEDELARARAKIQELRAEKDAVLRREPEVQRLLNEAGERYRALMMPSGSGEAGAGTGTGTAEDGVEAAATLLDRARVGGDGDTPRGLESLGTTPVRRSPPQVES
ncbi:nineteen complex-related protein 2-domain-containing protein [Biscogniauxia sp. FL1348]|nr:nineteen complex-related protein 2-domain-containing protein [Biscogniauxia sp. FL1348]